MRGSRNSFDFSFLIYLVGLWGKSNPLVCQYHQQQHHMKRGWGGEEWGNGGRLSWGDGISIWHRRRSSELCRAEMSKAATEKEPSHQNFDIDEAVLHTIYVTSNTHQLLYHGLRHFPFLSSVSGKFNCFIFLYFPILFSFIHFIQQTYTHMHCL